MEPNSLERVANFREVRDYPGHEGRKIAPGRLFRSGHWGRASESDLDAMRTLGIRTVIDFRSSQDLEVDGTDRLPRGVEHVHVPMEDPARGTSIRDMIEGATPEQIVERFGDGKAEGMMEEAAYHLVTVRQPEYSAYMKRMAEPGTPPVLFHCSAGKDRAGWAGSVLLLALGVDEEQVIDEYLKSNHAAAAIAVNASGDARPEDGGNRGGGVRWDGVLAPLLEVRREYVLASLRAVREHFGDFDGYLSGGLGLDAAARDALRANWLA